MKKTLLLIIIPAAAFCAGFILKNARTEQTARAVTLVKTANMKLGAFSISLNVKDLSVSKQFYENLGFSLLAGGMEKHYLIMKNGNALIGLFHGMFQGNVLTFNPGWDESGKNMETYDDVREIQRQLKSKGVKLSLEADEKTSGPGSLMTTDPDGNVLLFDQHR
jgi:catechol 2,3-dioxygenase-like lactoylglutathione lyase family enzyme